MSDSTDDPKAAKQFESFRPYAIIGTVLLVVFVTAILTPDYFNYRLRMERIKIAGKTSATSSAANSSSVTPSNKAESTGAVPSQSQTKVESETLSPPSTEPKSSEIFETYGKLLTMLLAFVSVLGVFFGYFVRKSLREVEEDMRQQVKDNMGFWEKERDRFFGEANSKLAEVTRQQSEVNKIIASNTKVLEVLQVSAKAEGQKPSNEAGLAASAVAEIDADNTIPAPPGGE